MISSLLNFSLTSCLLFCFNSHQHLPQYGCVTTPPMYQHSLETRHVNIHYRWSLRQLTKILCTIDHIFEMHRITLITIVRFLNCPYIGSCMKNWKNEMCMRKWDLIFYIYRFMNINKDMRTIIQLKGAKQQPKMLWIFFIGLEFCNNNN